MGRPFVGAVLDPRRELGDRNCEVVDALGKHRLAFGEGVATHLDPGLPDADRLNPDTVAIRRGADAFPLDQKRRGDGSHGGKRGDGDTGLGLRILRTGHAGLSSRWRAASAAGDRRR